MENLGLIGKWPSLTRDISFKIIRIVPRNSGFIRGLATYYDGPLYLRREYEILVVGLSMEKLVTGLQNRQSIKHQFQVQSWCFISSESIYPISTLFFAVAL